MASLGQRPSEPASGCCSEVNHSPEEQHRMTLGPVAQLCSGQRYGPMRYNFFLYCHNSLEDLGFYSINDMEHSNSIKCNGNICLRLLHGLFSLEKKSDLIRGTLSESENAISSRFKMTSFQKVLF